MVVVDNTKDRPYRRSPAPLRVSSSGGDGTRTHDFFDATEVVTDIGEQDNEHGAVELVDRVEAEWLGSQ
jgi:hypothetical protein